MLVPVAASVVFYLVFYSYLTSRPRRIGQQPDRGRARLVALLVSLVVLVVLWYLLIYLASRGLVAGIWGF